MKELLLSTCFVIGLTVVVHAQNAPLTDYTGKFNFPPGSAVPWVVVKLAADSTLYAESPNGNATLQRIEGDVFAILEHQGTAEFKRNNEGRVMYVKVTVGDVIMEGTREEGSSLPPAKKLPSQLFSIYFH